VSVYQQKGSPIYSFDFVVKGRRFSGSTGRTSIREARQVEAEERDKARETIKAEAKASVSLAINHVADRYWEAVGKHHAGADTTERDLERLVKYFGPDKLLSDITDAEVIKLVAWRRGQRRTVHRKHRAVAHNVPAVAHNVPLIAPATVNRSTTEVLKKLFTFAKREGARFEQEPVWKNHFLKEPQERVRELKPDEAEAIDAEVRDDYAPLFAFARDSGLRQSEAVLLRWSEVDFANGRISKAGKGGRLVSIQITPSIRDTLWVLQGHHPEFVFTYVATATRRRAGVIEGHRYPMTVSGLKTYWRRLKVRAGVETFRWHDYRHDFATKLLRETGNLKLVQRALNHQNIKTTMKYAHISDDEVAAAMEAVAKKRDTESQKSSQTKLKKVS
jgi:integrase